MQHKPMTTEPMDQPATPSNPMNPSTTEPLAGGEGPQGQPAPMPGEPGANEPGANEPGAAATLPRSAIARLSPTAGNEVRGTVTFTQTGTGVKVQISLTGLTPGEHGLHIHEKG